MDALQSLPKPDLCRDLHGWVDEVARLTQPQIVHWCTGTEAERIRLCELMIRSGTLFGLNPQSHPESYLAHTHAQGVEAARRLLCSRSESDAGPSNAWADPVYMHSVLEGLLKGSMANRVLYVVPYLLGVPGNPLCEAGVQITDSPLMAIVTSVTARVGRLALQRIRQTGRFVRGIHSLGSSPAAERMLCHWTSENGIACVGSSYLPDAVFALRGHGLRQAGLQARRAGWLAEAMSVVKVTGPDGNTSYLALCGSAGTGKTTLSLMRPPEKDLSDGWRVEAVSDELTWLFWDAQGQLRAINPLAGRCGPVANTNSHTCFNLQASLRQKVLFTNVGFTSERSAWWDDAEGPQPVFCTDWSGRHWTPHSTHPAAHADARYVISNEQCAVQAPESLDPAGVPISAIVLCSRRSEKVPLVRQADCWTQAVWMGATLKSERVPATITERPAAVYDPFGQRADCAYHLADHWQHWLNQSRRAGAELPDVFHANWFLRDSNGRYRWPGYRENFRVLKWIIDRTRGRGEAVRSPIGSLPTAAGLGLTGPAWTRETVRALLDVDVEAWTQELDEHEEFLARFSTRLPPELLAENDAQRKRMWHGRNSQQHAMARR